jgi:MFS superfamily sulfate permease-like transporter
MIIQHCCICHVACVHIIFGAPLIEQLSMAALTGLTIMVAIGTFGWVSLKAFGKMSIIGRNHNCT